MKDYYGTNIQAIDAMKDWLTPEEFKGFLKGNAIKYLARAGKKDKTPEIQDVEKATDYLLRLYAELKYETLEEEILNDDEELGFA